MASSFSSPLPSPSRFPSQRHNNKPYRPHGIGKIMNNTFASFYFVSSGRVVVPSPRRSTTAKRFLHQTLPIPTVHSSLRDNEDEEEEAEEEEEEVEGLGVKAALSMLRFYKREISPLIPSSCRYVPTCSEYSMEAYKRYGVVKGTILTAWRLCRCNPLGGSGFDPPRWFGEERPSEDSQDLTDEEFFHTE